MTLSRIRIFRLLLRWHSRSRNKQLTKYAEVLTEHFPYFLKLTDFQQKEFVYRLDRLKRSKRFRHIGLEKSLLTEVLVSAAAVQLTFGWKHYRMGFFRKIFIVKDAYTYGTSTVPWAGHVNRLGIHFSWRHFQYGYAVPNDRYNVGLHEMAHALEYEFAMGDLAENESLRSIFKDVLGLVENVIVREQWQRTPIYTVDSLFNKHECWAASVELFFENPAELHHYYPELYSTIRLLLNQDPLGSGGIG